MTTPHAAFSLPEYEALRSGLGFVELAHWTSFSLSGCDRQKFLHSFSTNDVIRLQPGEHCEVFITNVKGKLLGHGLVHCRGHELVLITVPGQAELLLAHLDRYILREEVQLRDTTAERSYLLVAGGESAETKLGTYLPIRWPLLDTPFCGLLEATSAELPSRRQALIAAGALPCSPPAFQAVRIESGTPLYGIDFNDTNFPQEVARNELAISFAKGCYLGQETVARIDALGHVNQQLAGVKFAGPALPAANTQLISSSTVVGHVTSATFSPALSAPLALAMIRRQWLSPGTRLESAAGACEVLELPICS